MSKRIKRMKQAAEDIICRKDAVIKQNSEELQRLRNQYENLELSAEDKQVIDDYIACKEARADRMAERLYEKGMKDVKRCIRIRKLIRRCVVLAAIFGVVLVEYDRNDKRWDKLDKILKLFPDAEETESEEV